MKKILATLFMASIMILSGCAGTGNKVLKGETSSTVSQKIVKGVTTQSDIRVMFGDPIRTSFTDSGNQIWYYEYSKTRIKATNLIPVVNMFKSGAKGRKKELAIFFDPDGVVRNYTMSSSALETDTGFLR